ncbi:MarR family winged helix-turn-helix transcriptional regulator [Anaeromicropila herbilytica]|uniref:HTH-type transcriptional regulator SarZ n=1 Tax=Anaeromicropila herbilytica TaxID=2785025 RepID=A0A7R7EKQ5_9FIRM|nr:MarR family winged helix-turn-helix transcriptional regulator [Anaeromicropila herbilytica]BCN30615.1 MarR family transcriptional regulator [Anaeromicropila herbilytica]
MENKIDKLTYLMKLNSNIYRCSQAYIDKHLAKYNLSMSSYPYLLVLKRCSGISQNDISKELNVDKSMSARTIKKLIEEGYIRKEQNKEDIRAYQLYLTDKAREIIPEILTIVQDWIDIIVPETMYSDAHLIENGLSFLEQVLTNGKKYRHYCSEHTKGDE